MSIYVTGDTHGSTDFYKLRKFADEHSELTKEDYVIIAGDFGAIWNNKTLAEDLKPYSELPFTVLFVDGNHENFDLINSFPVEEWRGGKVHKIKPNIIHLMRGQVFEIEGKTFLTLGGATSIDKAYRSEGISWWKIEELSIEDFDRAITNLKRYNYKVDYIISHSCGQRALRYPPLRNRKFQIGIYPENMLLTNIEEMADFNHWYFGHYHMDANLNDKMTVLYNDILKIV